MTFTIVLTVIGTFASGLFLALLLQFIKDRRTKNKLKNQLKKACNNILKNYISFDLKTGRGQVARILFPQIDHIIYSGQLHYFNFEIQNQMAQILMQQKGLDDIVHIVLDNLFLKDKMEPSKIFNENYKRTQKGFMDATKELLDLLE